MCVSSYQDTAASQPSLASQAFPFVAFTHGKLTFDRKEMVGGLSGYSGPQKIFNE
jgi:hypothetical protein